jgi:hypothetical protein
MSTNGHALEANPVLQNFIAAVASGESWPDALLEAAAAWTLSYEVVGERNYCYLLGGEAFDLLTLAERLLDEVADYVPDRERVDLVFNGRWPDDLNDEQIRARIGEGRHAAHLNFLYGVTVEEALQLAYELEVLKEKTSRVWGDDLRTAEGEQAFERLYGRGRSELLQEFLADRHEIHLPADTLGLGDLREFTYWLFKYRVAECDPARVASDTRKGLGLLSRMELETRQRRRSMEQAEPAEFLETSAWVAHRAS